MLYKLQNTPHPFERRLKWNPPSTSHTSTIIDQVTTPGEKEQRYRSNNVTIFLHARNNSQPIIQNTPSWQAAHTQGCTLPWYAAIASCYGLPSALRSGGADPEPGRVSPTRVNTEMSEKMTKMMRHLGSLTPSSSSCDTFDLPAASLSFCSSHYSYLSVLKTCYWNLYID